MNHDVKKEKRDMTSTQNKQEIYRHQSRHHHQIIPSSPPLVSPLPIIIIVLNLSASPLTLTPTATTTRRLNYSRQRSRQLSQHVTTKHLPNHTHPAAPPLQSPRHVPHQFFDLLRVSSAKRPSAVNIQAARPLCWTVKLAASSNGAVLAVTSAIQWFAMRVETIR